MSKHADKIYAVCFDLDGVIVDTADWPQAICEQIRQEFGITEEVWDDPAMRGANQIQVANIFHAHAQGTLSVQDFLDRCETIDTDMVAARIKLRSGIEAVIQHLERNSVLTGICTNGLHSGAMDRLKTAELNGSDIESRMRFTVSQKDFGDDAKPHTRPLLISQGRIQTQWGKVAGDSAPDVEAKNILVIGDTDKDIIPAAALGMPSIHWPYPGKTPHPNATHIVHSPDELLAAVRSYEYKPMF